jgi:hypothetical protein
MSPRALPTKETPGDPRSETRQRKASPSPPPWEDCDDPNLRNIDLFLASDGLSLSDDD